MSKFQDAKMARIPKGKIQVVILRAVALAGVMASFVLFPLHAQESDKQMWINIGPTPRENGATGRVTAVGVDSSDSTHWLIGAATGGIWESRDSGKTWSPRTDGQPTLATGAIAFAPSNPKIVYAGTGEPCCSRDAHVGLGLLKSVDGGTTWELIQTPSLVRASVAAIRVHSSDPNTLVAATTRGTAGRFSEPVPSPPEFGVLRSTDGGLTWKLTMSGEVTALDVDPADFNNQYAAIGDPNQPAQAPAFASARKNGVYRSIDGGQTWSFINGPWTSMAVTTGKVVLAIAPSNPNSVYASIENPAGGTGYRGLLGLFRTDNAWEPTPAWIRIPTDVTGPQAYCGSQCSSAHVIAVDPSDANTVVAGGQDLWRCHNCGRSPSWTNIKIYGDHRVLFWRGNRLISGNDGGVVSSTNAGDTWQSHNGTLTLSQFFGADLHPSNPNFILAGEKDEVGTIWTGGWIWRGMGPAYRHTDIVLGSSDLANEGEVAMSTTHPDTDWMASSNFGEISRTLDGGMTAPGAVNGITEPLAAVTPPVRKCPSIDDVFLTGNNLLWRTDNFFSGNTVEWKANADALGSTIRGIAFAPSDSKCNTYAYGTAAGQIRLTVDGGKTWTNLDPGKTLPARGVNTLAFDPASPSVLYAGISGFNLATPGKPGHLFKTTNALTAPVVWTDVSPGADVPFDVVTIDPSDPKSIFVGTDSGLWHSGDRGSSWQRMGPEAGLPNVPVYDIKINPATKRAVAFTYGRGAYMLSGLGFDPPPALVNITTAAHGATYIEGSLVPGSWAQVKGTNLSSVTRIWNDSDFVGLGNQLPTKLSGIEVKVNGVSAAVYYVSPTQISFQVPSGILAGPAGFILVSSPVTVVVYRDGISSQALITTGTSSSPGIFPITVNGKNYPAGVFYPDGKITGDPAAGAVFRKARPGDTIQLYATGLIRQPGGVLPTPYAVGGVTVKIGDISVTPEFASLVAVGEFQINFRVPQQFASLPEGDYPISIQLKLDDGAISASPTTINSDPPRAIVLPIQH
jgi:uncharacterized protein (TIGR03437 family)